MSSVIIEIKNEYLNHLVNLLSPMILHGLQSIYNEALEIDKKNNLDAILKVFQTCLKSIISWNHETIHRETKRIITTIRIANKHNSMSSFDETNLINLIKVTLKSYIQVLTFTIKNPSLMLTNYYNNIELSKFIHLVYIECASVFWNNPYLLYHNYPPIELKKNQRESLIIIKDCIRESLKKLLPLSEIINSYLISDSIEIIEDINQSDENQNIKPKSQINTLFYNKNNSSNTIESKINIKNSDNEKKNKDINLKDSAIKSVIQSIVRDSNVDEDTIKSCKSAILNIINRKIDTTVSNNNIQKDTKKSVVKSIVSNDVNNTDILDDKIKNILSKDLAINESDMETSLINDNDGYQDIFSNSNLI